jgi:hypothetical protein
MRAKLSVLAGVVLLAVGVLGLQGGDKEPSCEDRFGSPTGKHLRESNTTDKDEAFICLSDVVTVEGQNKKTFVWVLHNDKPSSTVALA